MNIFLTFDYELFFGEIKGTVQKSIIEPTEKLMEIAEKHNVCFTFFVDVGYLIQLEKFKNHYPNLQIDYQMIMDNIKLLLSKGHDLELHVHPHWETATYDGGEWSFDAVNFYKLTDFNQEDLNLIFSKYHKYLSNALGYKTPVFRAGGWCLQPFEKVKQSFVDNEIKIDSTVFPGGFFDKGSYYFDFRNAPNIGRYFFENDLCVEDKQGRFLEIPIGGWKYKPIFYWKLYVLGRLSPKYHKMLGDGFALSQPGRKWKNLKYGSWNHVSCDGYFAAELEKITNKYSKQNRSDLAIIGHPKGMTLFSLKKLDSYIGKMIKNGHVFKTLKEEIWES